ncbi:hypothetical protein DSO57_1029394 [Entomophthora muscae]|uniref:Uncharacterized protein n=1 Tax=Entomophthora muscae TaxID=34485 RepID=A0ACC2TN58_9FUNG|nr:hypothetical protein DSO57_1029394 [Entomophthora muscae]
MSDPKRVYTKLEQSSLRLALGDSSLRAAIHSPAAAIAWTHSTSTNSRTITLVIVVSPALRSMVLSVLLGAEKLSPLATYTKLSSSSPGVDILTSDDHLARVASAAPEERATKMGSRLSGPSTTRRNIVRNIPAYTPARSYSPPYSPRNC